MTNGASRVMSGPPCWPAAAVAYAAMALATALFNTVNVLSILDEEARSGTPLPWWEPAVWEGTSAVAILAMAWLPMLMVRRFPPEAQRRLPALAAHAAATLVFSIAHVALMVALREAAYAAAGEDYEFAGGSDGLLYEYRKDVVTYIGAAAVYWIVRRLRKAAPAGPSAEPAAPGHIEIDEGHRLIRVRKTDLLCARSSGNYVEFFLADGRRPLMRTTLARVEAQLTSDGFVRTHRSWLVNRAHFAEAAAEGSGDYGLKLSDGTEVPLSRRYPEALAALRG